MIPTIIAAGCALAQQAGVQPDPNPYRFVAEDPLIVLESRGLGSLRDRLGATGVGQLIADELFEPMRARIAASWAELPETDDQRELLKTVERWCGVLTDERGRIIVGRSLTPYAGSRFSSAQHCRRRAHPMNKEDDRLDVGKAVPDNLGLGSLRVGSHWIRDRDGARVASVRVDSVYVLHVSPTFHLRGAVGLASARGEPFRGATTADWIKAFLVVGEACAVLQLQTDPLTQLLADVPLSARRDTVDLDGVGYRLLCRTTALSAQLEFSNPTEARLCDVASAFWAIAENVARESAGEMFGEFVASWRRYMA